LYHFFAENGKNETFSAWNANRLEIKQRVQRGMTFLILTYTFVMAAEKLNFFRKKMGSNFFLKIQNSVFCRKCDIFFRFFHCSSAKLRRTAKRPTVLSNLLNMLTILIIFRKIYFLINFLIFCGGCITFLRKMAKMKNF